MYLPIARRYRPKTFSQVFGQNVTCRIMTNSILMDREIKGMLLTGIRGTGKTTLARLYAKSLNCLKFKELKEPCCECASCIEADNGSHRDIIELDAASHNGVDFVRELKVVVDQIPTYQKRVIIFDEAHMFSKQAQAALLKMLEEPPDHLNFILVTTDPDMLISTVRSRCLGMPLRALTSQAIEASVRYILDSEGREYDEDFVSTLGRLGGGALRDVQQLLDQCILAAGDERVDSSYLESAVGVVSVAQYRRLAPVICGLNAKTALERVNEWHLEGMDLQLLFIEGLPNLLRDFAVILANAYSEGLTLLTGLPADKVQKKLTLSYKQVNMALIAWEELVVMMQRADQPKLIWEIFFMKICEGV